MNNSMLLMRRYWKKAKFQNNREKKVDKALPIKGNSWNLGQNTVKGTWLYIIDFAAVTCAQQTWPFRFVAFEDCELMHVLCFYQKNLQGVMRMYKKNQEK